MNNIQEHKNTFVIEVAKYFRDFLETDFKRKSIPKITINKLRKEGLRVGLKLDQYPKFKEILIENLHSGFQKQEIIIKKGEYTRNIPLKIFFSIELRIQEIKQSDLNNFFEKVIEKINEKKGEGEKKYDKMEVELFNEIKNCFLEVLITPLIDDVKKILENLDFLDDTTKFELEIEILESIFSYSVEELREGLCNFFKEEGNGSIDFKKKLKKIFVLENIQKDIVVCFNNFLERDLFDYMYKIYRNSELMDKSEFYFYFYEISFKNHKFPLFYTNLHVTVLEKDDTIKIELDKKLYFNTKGLDFVVQEYNKGTEGNATLHGEFRRILYDDFYNQIHSILKTLEHFFFLSKGNIEILKSKNRELVNSTKTVRLSDETYFFLAEKGNESLINDYEEIISGKNVSLLESFSQLLESFIKENPKSFIKEIEIEWKNSPIRQKLIYQSPIPLNEEQRQVIHALERADCKFIIIEGPPGTGKSHTITSIICKALLEGKSVLVLSDKKEALDVVEDKITTTLNKVRYESKDFQNPILRLGNTGNNFGKIIGQDSLIKIKEHNKIGNNGDDALNVKKNRIIRQLESNLEEIIKHFTGISLEDIAFYVSNFEKYKDIDFISDEREISLKNDFINIKDYLSEIKKKNKSDIELGNVSQEYLKAMLEIKSILCQINEKKKNMDSLEEIKDYVLSLSYEKVEFLDNFCEDLEKMKKFISSLGDGKKFLKNYNHKNYTLELFFDDIKKLENNINLSKEASKFFENRSDKIPILSNFFVNDNGKLPEILDSLKSYVSEIENLKLPLIGYVPPIFIPSKIKKINSKYIKHFYALNISTPQKEIDVLSGAVINLFEFLVEKLSKENGDAFDINSILKLLIERNSETILKLNEICYFIDLKNKYEKYLHFNLFEKDYFEGVHLGMNINKLRNLIDNCDSDYIHDILCKDVDDHIKYMENLVENMKILLSIKDKIDYLYNFYKNYPHISKKIELNLDTITSKLDNYSNDFISTYFEFKKIEFQLSKSFNNVPNDIYSDYIIKLQDIITHEMAKCIDERFIDYVENYVNEVHTLKKIISKGGKFSKELFFNLKKAFPCIIASIRDYANYIPLEKDLFDVIIIDEASQVSIAQAFSAFIRGKQIVILGDNKQFSNVKSLYAPTEINNRYKLRIETAFKKDYIFGEDTLGLLMKVRDSFDVKNNVLQFVKFIRNYEIQLRKHFRSYPELISYSNTYFYSHSLQCMKIRGKNIEDTIKFDFIEHDGRFDENENINELEANFIIQTLQELKEKGIQQTVGIITPFREQVLHLFKKIDSLKDKNYFFNDLKLKIMTFDSCQGEERDYIFYSMVATEQVDKLQYIFPKSLSRLDDESEGNLKAQRLNVGFSRAKETVHFVLSKPIEKFSGEIQNALFHFKQELENGKKQIIGGTDTNSPMEQNIQNYFYETDFYKENKDKIEFIPQFPIGEYLQQLDRTYNHPKYKVDFLLIFEKQKIIIEYDGFKEHFTHANVSEINRYNYECYMKESDIYRQKILEGYGYKFLRINMFNIGENPVKTLNDRIKKLIKNEAY